RPGDMMAKKKPEMSWTEANQASLVAEFARLKTLLGAPAEAPAATPAKTRSRAKEAAPPAIDVLTALFGLSAFERDVLLLCAGVERDQKPPAVWGEGPGRAHRPCATSGIATAVLPAPHWSALAPARPLRRFRLVELDAAQGLTAAPLRIDERILHYL